MKNIEDITSNHTKLSRALKNSLLETFIRVLNPDVDPFSEAPDTVEMSDKLQQIGIVTKRNLVYLLFE